MEDGSPETQQWSGRLVALEGDIDTISTQLRLLPPSPKILVLPPCVDSLPQDNENQLFDAHAFIRGAHEAFTDRIEAAKSFLRSSTTTQPRLVFMNGGCVRARKTCISRISKNLTHGDTSEAETLFNQITRHGAARLLKFESDISETGPDVETDSERDITESAEDPSVAAMKAAELLYCETATLQAEDIGLQEDLFDNLNPRARRSYAMGIRQNAKTTPEVHLESPTIYGVVESNDEEFLGGHGEDAAAQNVLTIRSHSSVAECRHFPLQRSLTTASSYTTVSMYQVEESGDGPYDKNPVSYWDESHMSMPPTPVVVYGQAFLVDVQTTSPEKQPRRIRSVDRFFSSRSRYREAAHSARPASSIALGGRGLQTLPRKSFLRASETTIKKSPASTKSASSSEGKKNVEPEGFVDRGTDTADIPVERLAVQESPPEEFVPIFPLVEDLVVSFDDGQPDEIFNLIIRCYKNGYYPAIPPLFPSNYVGQITALDPENANVEKSPAPSPSTEKDDPGYESRPSYDPYGSDDSYSASTERPWPPREKLFRANSCIQRPNSQTRPPERVAEKFIHFPLSAARSIVETHNSLRKLFNIHFPSGQNGYSQHYFPVVPEMDRIWKPVFGNSPLVGGGNEAMNIDQIIALGCETGVSEEFCDQISWGIEKLAVKNDRFNKSARLDLRYLIANVVQASSAYPPNAPELFNPLVEPSVLATLLVPQLEAYLAANKSTRLLILQYPSSHLPTMIALRKTLGEGFFKIAGILNSFASDPPSIVHRPPPLSTHNTRSANYLPSSTYHAASLNATLASDQKDSSSVNPLNPLSRSKQSRAVSFAKANYVLPSTATENEIATFKSKIHTSLVERSVSYASEPQSRPVMVEAGVQAPPIPPIPKTTKQKTSTAPTGTRSIRGSTRDYDQDRESLYPPSSFKTPTIRRARETKKKWDNFYVGDEDSDDDEFDRMILGRKHAKILPEVRTVGTIPPKKNMQKALKWLGVA